MLKQTSRQNKNKIQRLNQLLIENHYDISSALSYFANELSMKSHYATLVVRPKHSEEMINNVHLIKANDSIMILVIIYNSGHVEHFHLNSSLELSSDRLIAISNFISNNNLEMSAKLSNKINSFASSNEEKQFINDIVKMINSHISKTK